MKIINSFQDLRRYISGQFERIDVSCYTEDFDTLVLTATNKLNDILHEEYDFEYGNQYPENNIDYFELIKEFEI